MAILNTHAGASAHLPPQSSATRKAHTFERRPLWVALYIIRPPGYIHLGTDSPCRLQDSSVWVQTSPWHIRLWTKVLPQPSPRCAQHPSPRQVQAPSPAEQQAGCLREARSLFAPVSARVTSPRPPLPHSQPRQADIGEEESRASNSPPASCCGFSRSPA